MRPDYSDEFEAFSEALALEWYLHRSGQKSRLELEPVYGRYADLFRHEEIAALRSEAETAYLERDRKGYRYLAAAAVEHHAASLARPLTEAIEGHDAQATVVSGGASVPMRAVPVLLANEPRADVRNDLASRAERLVSETNDLRAERLERVASAATELGASSWGALRAELEGVDGERLAAAASDLLAMTERRYTDALADAMTAQNGVRLASATDADAVRLFRLAGYDRIFPAARLGVLHRDTLTGLGIRPGAQKNVALDLSDRPLKDAEPFCARVRIPERVLLVSRPVGGYTDFVSLFEVTGCAQHAAFTSPETRPAFARAGDRAARAAWALLFRNLLVDPDWIAEHIGADDKYLASASLHRCYLVRRDAGLAVYEEALQAGRTSLAAAPAAFEEAIDEATRVANGRAGYLRAAGSFQSADALRAWALEVLLRDRLKTRFGRRWWASGAAGNMLKEIWSSGSEYSVDELAVELELGTVSLDPLEADLLEGIAA